MVLAHAGEALKKERKLMGLANPLLLDSVKAKEEGFLLQKFMVDKSVTSSSEGRVDVVSKANKRGNIVGASSPSKGYRVITDKTWEHTLWHFLKDER